ncbi:hypothetical protein [Asticcacaulis sp. W401b]|uniref:hypothetical protein n=1 Tax=Asticcacaulis sp. W401b TaxID=3388666 RepID=UPI003970F9A0
MRIAQRLLVAWGLLLLAACDAGPSAVLSDEKSEAPARQVAPVEAAAPRATPSEALSPVQADAPAKREDSDAIRLPVGPQVEITSTHYGDWPLWSSNRKYSAYQNATHHFEKHGGEVGARSYEEWLGMVHGFIHAPPEGVETLVRNNGDTLFYDSRRNVFAVMTKNRAPRTLFRPSEGARYWQKQKQIEAKRRTITRDNFDPSVD